MRSVIAYLLIAVVLLALAGCGGPRLYPVHGKVTWENGSEARELAGGLVICESADGKLGARGDIEKDGSFRLSTNKPGDGILPGKYRVAVVEYSPKEPPPPPTIDRAFTRVDASGLEINVDGTKNEVTLKVRHAPPHARR
jgi:predicted small lipoprotein YifL